MAKFKMTVLMPVFNSGRTVSTSIKSVLSQSYKNFDFIIVNDGSTDGTDSIIRSFKDDRIKYFACEHKGRSAASNFGISKAETEYIARIDSDDLFFKYKLEKQVSFLKYNKNVDALFTWSIFFDRNMRLRFWKSPVLDKEIKQRLYYLNPINHSSVIFRRKIIQNLSGYDINLDINEDYDLWLKASKSAVFHCLPEYLVFSRLKEKNMSKKFNSYLVKRLYDNNVDVYRINKKENNDILGRIEYYYGDIRKAIKLLLKGHITTNFYLLICSLFTGITNGKIRGNKLSLFLSKDMLSSAYYRNILKSMTSED